MPELTPLQLLREAYTRHVEDYGVTEEDLGLTFIEVMESQEKRIAELELQVKKLTELL